MMYCNSLSQENSSTLKYTLLNSLVEIILLILSRQIKTNPTFNRVSSPVRCIFTQNLDFLCQFRHSLEQVCHQAKVGHLEDGSLSVLVDCYDHLAVLHACQMLDGTRDANGDVEVRCHNLSGLPDLHVVGHHASVHSSSAGSKSSAEFVSKGVKDDSEVIAALHATATTHDNRGSAEVRAIGFAQFLSDKLRGSSSGGFSCRGGLL